MLLLGYEACLMPNLTLISYNLVVLAVTLAYKGANMCNGKSKSIYTFYAK